MYWGPAGLEGANYCCWLHRIISRKRLIDQSTYKRKVLYGELLLYIGYIYIEVIIFYIIYYVYSVKTANTKLYRYNLYYTYYRFVYIYEYGVNNFRKKKNKNIFLYHSRQNLYIIQYFRIHT